MSRWCTLTDALCGLGLAHGLILTDVNAEPIVENGLTIEIRSLAEWFVQSSAVTARRHL